MDRTAPAAHASHDELLLARLYGGDLDELERADALTQMAECDECAALFADFGTIAGATAAMPVPTRPRDFSLTEDDAARLRRTVRARPAIFGAGLRRAFGGSLAALGLVGAVLTGSASLLGQAAAPASNMALGDARQNVPVAAGAASQEDTAAWMESPAAKGSTVPLTPGSSVAELNGDGASPAPRPTGSGSTQTPGYEFGPATKDGGGLTDGNSDKTASSADQRNQGGMDSRLVWLIGFGLLFVVGLGIMVLPWAIGRRRRG